MLEKLTAVFNQYTDIETTVTEKTDIKFDLGLDSLQFSNIAASIEDEFGVEISDSEALEIETVGDIMRLLSEKLG